MADTLVLILENVDPPSGKDKAGEERGHILNTLGKPKKALIEHITE